MHHQIPQANRLCSNKANLRKWDLHQERMGKIKGRKKNHRFRVNARPDSTRLMHLKLRQKKAQMQYERYAEIQRENGILLGKVMSCGKDTTMARIRATEHLPSRGDAIPSALIFKHKKNVRRDKLLKIERENEEILRRLMTTKAYYDKKEIDESAELQEEKLKHMSYFHPDPLLERTNNSPRYRADIDGASQSNSPTKSHNKPSRPRTDGGKSRSSRGGRRSRNVRTPHSNRSNQGSNQGSNGVGSKSARARGKAPALRVPHGSSGRDAEASTIDSLGGNLISNNDSTVNQLAAHAVNDLLSQPAWAVPEYESEFPILLSPASTTHHNDNPNLNDFAQGFVSTTTTAINTSSAVVSTSTRPPLYDSSNIVQQQAWDQPDSDLDYTIDIETDLLNDASRRTNSNKNDTGQDEGSEDSDKLLSPMFHPPRPSSRVGFVSDLSEDLATHNSSSYNSVTSNSNTSGGTNQNESDARAMSSASSNSNFESANPNSNPDPKPESQSDDESDGETFEDRQQARERQQQRKIAQDRLRLGRQIGARQRDLYGSSSDDSLDSGSVSAEGSVSASDDGDESDGSSLFDDSSTGSATDDQDSDEVF